MSVIKWDPFSEFPRDFERLFPGFFRGGARWPAAGGKALDWTPSADISENDSEFTIRADLPAVKKEDVKITVEQGMITIQGERKDKQEQKNEKFHRVESFQGTFARSFALPANVDEKQIRAESDNGVLVVHLPKAKVEKPKSVEVKVQ